MAAFTDFAENRLIDWLLRGQAAPALPATWFMALFTSAVTDTGSALAEVAGGSYARAQVPRSLAAFAGTQGPGTTAASSGAGGITTNNQDINFLQPTATWGTVSHWGLFDAAAGGNLWIYGPLTTPMIVQNGSAAPKVPAGALEFQMDD